MSGADTAAGSVPNVTPSEGTLITGALVAPPLLPSECTFIYACQTNKQKLLEDKILTKPPGYRQPHESLRGKANTFDKPNCFHCALSQAKCDPYGSYDPGENGQPLPMSMCHMCVAYGVPCIFSVCRVAAFRVDCDKDNAEKMKKREEEIKINPYGKHESKIMPCNNWHVDDWAFNSHEHTDLNAPPALVSRNGLPRAQALWHLVGAEKDNAGRIVKGLREYVTPTLTSQEKHPEKYNHTRLHQSFDIQAAAAKEETHTFSFELRGQHVTYSVPIDYVHKFNHSGAVTERMVQRHRRSELTKANGTLMSEEAEWKLMTLGMEQVKNAARVIELEQGWTCDL